MKTFTVSVTFYRQATVEYTINAADWEDAESIAFDRAIEADLDYELVDHRIESIEETA